MLGKAKGRSGGRTCRQPGPRLEEARAVRRREQILRETSAKYPEICHRALSGSVSTSGPQSIYWLDLVKGG